MAYKNTTSPQTGHLPIFHPGPGMSQGAKASARDWRQLRDRSRNAAGHRKVRIASQARRRFSSRLAPRFAIPLYQDCRLTL